MSFKRGMFTYFYFQNYISNMTYKSPCFFKLYHLWPFITRTSKYGSQ